MALDQNARVGLFLVAGKKAGHSAGLQVHQPLFADAEEGNRRPGQGDQRQERIGKWTAPFPDSGLQGRQMAGKGL